MATAPTPFVFLTLGHYAYAAVAEAPLQVLKAAPVEALDSFLTPGMATQQGRVGYDAEVTPLSGLNGYLADETHNHKGQVAVCWQPSSMIAQKVDVPQCKRDVFAMLESVTSSNPTIVQTDCAWSYDPLPSAVKQGKVWLHLESVPGLNSFGLTLQQAGYRMDDAYSLLTLILSTHSRVAPKTLVFAEGYAALVVTPAPGIGIAIGKSNCLVFDWAKTTDPENTRMMLQHSLDSTNFYLDNKQNWRVVGDKEHCEAAGAFLSAGSPEFDAVWHTRVIECAMPWHKFLATALKQVRRLNDVRQNLWDTFPRERPIGGLLLTLGGLGLAAGFACAFVGWQAYDASRREVASITQRIMADKQKLTATRELATEIATMEERASALGEISPPRGRADILRALSDALPETCTYTRMALDVQGNLTAQFMVVSGEELDLGSLTKRFEAAGFVNCIIERDGGNRRSETLPAGSAIKLNVKAAFRKS